MQEPLGIFMVWVTLAAGFIFLALHPFVTYPLSLRVAAWLRPWQPKPAAPADPPMIGILFCAYNEEAVIIEKLQNCLALKAADPACEVLVYTDGCSDRTVDIVRSFGDGVRLYEGKERRGKSFGMNMLAQLAQAQGADLLFFTDANVILDDGVLDAMRSEFADASVGCVTGHLDYINPDESPTAMVGSRYWTMDETVKRLETRSGSCVGADGSIFAIRAKLFRKVPENIIDDFFTSMSVLCDGWRCIYSDRVVAWERSATKPVEEYRRKVRIACRAFNCHRLLLPRLLHLPPWDLYKYVSHKLVRWLTAFWIAGALACIVMALLTSGLPWTWLAAIALVVGALGAATAWWPGTPWAQLREVSLAFLATAVGVVKSLQGERFQTWSQAASTRQPQPEMKSSVNV
jgi:cellulose synthase/poly-beta-1,6-N-acetylglucosamine synthase-like glycosyltransferase